MKNVRFDVRCIWMLWSWLHRHRVRVTETVVVIMLLEPSLLILPWMTEDLLGSAKLNKLGFGGI